MCQLLTLSAYASSFSSVQFRVLGLRSRSSVHLELRFVQAERSGSSFTLLHVAIQLTTSFVEDVVFSPICNFDFCQNPGGHRWWTYNWVLSSNEPSNMSVLLSLPCCFYIQSSEVELTTKVLVFPAVLLLFKLFGYPVFFVCLFLFF